MRRKLRLALAGGGTGGHIMPNIAIINDLRMKLSADAEDSPEILYFGTKKGMEEKLVAPLGVKFRAISCGKLRRYFSLQNFADFFKIPVGIFQAYFTLLFFKPQVIFCKGGYVSFPVAVAGWLNRIPVVLHESDVVPGLANKLSARFSRVICVSWEETKKYFPLKKVVFTGNPVRPEITEGNPEDAREFTGLKEKLPTVLIMGGSQGAESVNEAVFSILKELVRSYQIIHICGEKQVNEGQILLRGNPHSERYKSFAFIGDNLKHVYSLSDLIVSRAGANSLFEIELLNKPSVIIPLGTKSSRGDQIVNAETYAKNHDAIVIDDDPVDEAALLSAINKLAGESISEPQKGSTNTAASKISGLLLNLTK
jgi:UDP-N-acetylglucosamine--N-acetylmuramyl-(pentapeptide) pyrophosphoryl-undecaprenol N-acetylglucosamine transferase